MRHSRHAHSMPVLFEDFPLLVLVVSAHKSGVVSFEAMFVVVHLPHLSIFVFILGKDVDDPGALRLLERIRKHINKRKER